eukprot:1607781-Amphidinium_carterae.1
MVFLRAVNFIQQSYCDHQSLYPGDESHLNHHPRLSACQAVTAQLQVTRTSSCLYEAWNLTPGSYDHHRPPTFPFLQRK